MAKVSIIVPVYNTEKYLKKCLDSLTHQTLEDIEIIVVNDSSPDNSKEIIDEYAKKDKRVKSYIKPNAGQGDARNFGLEKATGEYIGYVDSDDFIDSHMYEDMYNKASETNSDMVVCGFYECLENGKILSEKHFNFSQTKFNLDSNKEILFDNTVVWNKLYKAALLKENNIKFRTNKWYEDFDFVIKTVYYASCISLVDTPYYYYLRRAGSTMNNSNITKNLDILDAMDEILDFFKAQGIYEKYSEELEFLAVQHIYLPTNVRVIRAKISWNKKLEIIHKINEYMDRHFLNYKRNKYIKIILTKKKRSILTLITLKMYWLVYACFKIQDLFRK